MLTVVVCADCDSSFVYRWHRGPRRQYCNRCRSRHDWRIPTTPMPRPCKICGVEITKRADALTCSGRCRRQLSRLRLRAAATEFVPPVRIGDQVGRCPVSAEFVPRVLIEEKQHLGTGGTSPVLSSTDGFSSTVSVHPYANGWDILATVGGVRRDLAAIRRDLAAVRANADRIPELIGRLERLEAERL